ncbi:hypothetical protein ACF0H5_013053 [Mactra antiquata]
MIQSSEKMDCPAKIKYRMIVKFPDFKLQGKNSRKNKEEIVAAVRETHCDNLNCEYNVLLLIDKKHTNHIMGEDASCRLPLDKRV